MARTKMDPQVRAYRLLARHKEAANMCRHDYSTTYIVKYGHVSASTVTALRRALALTEGLYSSSHSKNFTYDWN